MSFGWDLPIKVEKKRTDGSVIVEESTPKQVIKEPNRHRVEDIVNSLCAVLSEIIIMEESRSESTQRVLEMMNKKKEEKVETGGYVRRKDRGK